jgi:hypothetical protein
MSEQLTPKAASEIAGKNYQDYKLRVESAGINQDEAELWKQDAMSYQDVLDGVVPDTYSEGLRGHFGKMGVPEDAKTVLERSKHASLRKVGEYATNVATNEVEGRRILNEGRSFNEANNGALQDAATAEAMLDGVHINVQQQAEGAQQVPVQTAEHVVSEQ